MPYIWFHIAETYLKKKRAKLHKGTLFAIDSRLRPIIYALQVWWVPLVRNEYTKSNRGDFKGRLSWKRNCPKTNISYSRTCEDARFFRVNSLQRRFIIAMSANDRYTVEDMVLHFLTPTRDLNQNSILSCKTQLACIFNRARQPNRRYIYFFQAILGKCEFTHDIWGNIPKNGAPKTINQIKQKYTKKRL